jgi:hypothetical protein
LSIGHSVGIRNLSQTRTSTIAFHERTSHDAQ